MNRNITATILIVIAVGIYLTITQNMFDKAKAIQSVNAQYASAIDSANQLVKVRDQVEAQWKNISPDDQARINKMIPGTVDNIRLIIDLNNVALKHGFSLAGITATAGNSGTGAAAASAAGSAAVSPKSASGAASIAVPTLDTVTISFNVTAPYLQFVSFMQDLEANLRIMDLTHLSVSANNSGIYTFNVQLQTYWLRQH